MHQGSGALNVVIDAAINAKPACKGKMVAVAHLRTDIGKLWLRIAL